MLCSVSQLPHLIKLSQICHATLSFYKQKAAAQGSYIIECDCPKFPLRVEYSEWNRRSVWLCISSQACHHATSITSKQSLGFLFSDVVSGLHQAKYQVHFRISLNGDLWVLGCVILNQGTHFLGCPECGLYGNCPI